MIKKERPKIYSQFEISVILFYLSMIFFTPVVLVFTYVFEVDQTLNINTFMFWVLMSNCFAMLLGSVMLAFSKESLRRIVKPTYRVEYIYLLILFMFGLLGFVVLYDYMGGDRAYIANIIVVLLAGFVYTLMYLGRKYFKFDYMRKK